MDRTEYPPQMFTAPILGHVEALRIAQDAAAAQLGALQDLTAQLGLSAAELGDFVASYRVWRAQLSNPPTVLSNTRGV